MGGGLSTRGNPSIKTPQSLLFLKEPELLWFGKSGAIHPERGRVFVVEGYMDLLALYSHGIENVVAVLGTALTEEHGKILKRWSPNVVLLFDGDQAGQMALERSLPHFLRQDLLPQVLVLPQARTQMIIFLKKGARGFWRRPKSLTTCFPISWGLGLGIMKATPRIS